MLVLLCFGESVAIKCVSMNNQSYLFRPTLLDLNPDEFYRYPVAISTNMCDGINESRTLAKHISCDCRCGFDGRKCNWRQRRNNSNDKCQCECKKPIKHGTCEEDYAWNHRPCACECDKDCKIPYT